MTNLMIDWLTVVLPIKHRPFDAGTICSIDSAGCLEWETKKYYHCEGSFDTKIQLKSQGYCFPDGDCSELYISGNPNKFIFGHNLFGSDSLTKILSVFLFKVFVDSHRRLDKKDFDRIMDGRFLVKCIDITRTFDAGNQLNVRQWLDAAAIQSRTRHGTPTTTGSTVYWGKKSRRYAIKAYDKNEEINSRNKKHRLSESLTEETRKKLTDWSIGKLRLELRILSKELKKVGCHVAKYLNERKIDELFNNYVSNIEMSAQVNLTDEKIDSLPRKLRGTYILWKEGFNVQQTLSKATFYRHKKELLKYGVDISLVNPKEKSNVVPMIKIIELSPAALPDFASEALENLDKQFTELLCAIA